MCKELRNLVDSGVETIYVRDSTIFIVKLDEDILLHVVTPGKIYNIILDGECRIKRITPSFISGMVEDEAREIAREVIECARRIIERGKKPGAGEAGAQSSR